MKIAILGGGITGLSSAWYCRKKYPDAHITLVEKTNRLGGAIWTSFEGGFLFEKGPRTFQRGRSPHLLALIQELNLEILTSPPLKRYIYSQGKLRSLGSLIPQLIPYLIRELFIAPSSTPDESIYDFAARRFSPKIAETFFDPITLGIYAGDIKHLSLKTCFPTLYRWEREKGSLVRGFLSSPKTEPGLFTLKGGMETLITALHHKIDMEVIFNSSVAPPNADKIISALPPPFPAKSIWVVNLGYTGDVLPKKGFGYLVPSQEKQSLLGMVFDSAIFPAQGVTRLTAMIRAEDRDPLQTALSAMHNHLKLTIEPTYTSVFYAHNAIPQFPVGSSYTDGISVDASILRGKKLGFEV